MNNDVGNWLQQINATDAPEICEHLSILYIAAAQHDHKLNHNVEFCRRAKAC